MATQTQNPPVLSRKNTFQRILDLEKQHKTNRMGSSHSTEPRPFATSELDEDGFVRYPIRSTITLNMEAMTEPKILLRIPKNTSNSMVNSEERIGAFMLPDEAPDNADDASDISSICYSPRWDDAVEKKERKRRHEDREKRKKEKERAEKEAKKKEHKSKRLTKGSPSKFSQMIVADRSSSTTAVPTLPTKEGNNPRRGSGDTAYDTIGFKGPRDSTVPPGFENARISRANDGFIGGLKLKQADAGIVLQTIQRQTSAEEKVVEEFTLNGDRATRNRLMKPTNIDLLERVDDLSSHRASPMVAVPPKPAATSQRPATITPIMDRQINRGHIRQRSKASSESIKGYIFPDRTDGRNLASSTRTVSPSPTSVPEGKRGNGQTLTRANQRKVDRSPERPPLSYREPQVLAEGRGRRISGSYVRGQRQQNRDRSISGYEDEIKVSSATASKKEHSRSRSWSITSFTRNGRKSSESSRPVMRDLEKGVVDHANVLTGPLIPTGMNPVTCKDIPPTGQRRFSQLSPVAASFINFKNSTKSAFQRHPNIPTSPPADLIFPMLTDNPQVRRRASSLSSRSASCERERELEISPAMPQPDTGYRTAPDSPHHPPSLKFSEPPMPWNDKNASRLRSTTSSSDTLNESTRDTTPSTSRPQSRKGKPPARNKNAEPVGFKSHPLERGNAVKPEGAILFDDTSRVYETWSRTALPINLDDNEECSPPACKKPASNFSQKKVERRPTPVTAITLTDIQRHPSLSKSVSTPDLKREARIKHDLSFLPSLKHQPFSKSTPSAKEKERATIPPTLPSSSPSSSASYAHSGPRISTMSQAGSDLGSSDPLAKMLVRCCSCHYFHDMPSKLYECMAKPDNVVEDRNLGVSGVISTAVKCPWCGHGMSTKCCEGWAAVVYLRERLH